MGLRDALAPYLWKRGDEPTLDALFRWLISFAAMISGLVIAWGVIVLGAIALSGTPYDRWVVLEYIGIPAAVAAVNVGSWRAWREAPFRQRNAAFVILANATLATADYILVMRTYGMSITSLELPLFLFIAMVAGILLELRAALAVATVVALQHAIVILVSHRLGASSDQNALPFLGAAMAIVYAFTLPASFISREIRSAERRIGDAQKAMSRFVSPQLADRILRGDAASVIRRERRKLTVFFSDIKDFTATADAMEPEDMARVLDEYLGEMIRIGLDHGGTIGQISGDGLYVFFGAPEFVSDEKHARDCVAMAVAMQRRMAELQAGWFKRGMEHPFQIRCGINTGMVTIGSFGSDLRRDYTAIGLQVNLAARLQAAADPGHIFLAHATWSLVQDVFPCDDKGELDVKGFHRPIRAWRVALEKLDVLKPATATR